MAKKKRSASDRPEVQAARASNGGPAAAAPAARARMPGSPTGAGAVVAIPAEVTRGDWTVLILALMMFFAPAMGVPHEEMLQDTLKSIIVAFGALGAALLFFWQQRNRREGLRWHAVMWLPLMLMVYALISMIWSHTYLGGVEAVRWFVFSVLVWLALNTVSREKLPMLAMGIHCGAVITALWGALQFWFNLKYFPQGPNPASTFVNRNFLAEFMACTLPFSFYLIWRARRSAEVSLLAATLAFNMVVIMMTGTRSALAASIMAILVLVPVAWVYREQLSFPRWSSATRILAIGVFLSTFVGLGLIKSNNLNVAGQAGVDKNAFQVMLWRSGSMTSGYEYQQGSFSIRLVMWKATVRMIQARPFSGVGAGAWEADIPLYQTEGSQLETDYYVHNEFLQLLAEYGLVGWVMLLWLLGYLSLSAWRTVRDRSPEGKAEAPLRAMVLTSLLAFLIVSNAGFPWRLAATGAIFALSLGILAASDARLRIAGWGSTTRLAWQPAYSQGLAVASMMALALAAFISQQAAECESKIVKAVKMAMTISASNDFNNPKWDKSKAELLKLIKEGTDINPHYRKITPMVGDELARWGDWRNATWIWESVISSRPYVVAIMTNVARGYASMGNPEKALELLARAKKIQPKATSVLSLEVVLLSRTGKEPQALKLARESVNADLYDFDLINAAFVLAWRGGDFPLAIKAMETRMRGWPNTRAAGLIQLGNMYQTGMNDNARAVAAFREAVMATPPNERQAFLSQVPLQFRSQMGPALTAPAAGSQTSASSK